MENKEEDENRQKQYHTARNLVRSAYRRVGRRAAEFEYAGRKRRVRGHVHERGLIIVPDRHELDKEYRQEYSAYKRQNDSEKHAKVGSAVQFGGFGVLFCQFRERRVEQQKVKTHKVRFRDPEPDNRVVDMQRAHDLQGGRTRPHYRQNHGNDIESVQNFRKFAFVELRHAVGGKARRTHENQRAADRIQYAVKKKFGKKRVPYAAAGSDTDFDRFERFCVVAERPFFRKPQHVADEVVVIVLERGDKTPVQKIEKQRNE